MPALAAPVADERAALEAYLAQQQLAFRAAAYGLTSAQAATPAAAPSTLTLGGLVKHVTFVQAHWLELALAGPSPVPVGDAAEVAAREQEYADQFRFDADDDLDAVLAAYDEVSARVLHAVRSLDPDTFVPVPDAPWFPKDIDGWSVRWVWFHLLEELARHAGHADIVREAVDGATMYALLAGLEGWPETPWLTPWRPGDQVLAEQDQPVGV